ncbi:MAG TPA: HIT family protein [Burkholderiaceae bacterium]|nr:HIT family protein [Burkholderiaceae bacterium]
MDEPASQCPFCSPDGSVLRNCLAYARFDRYPVTPGHLLLIPLRHEADFFATTHEERTALLDLMEQAKASLDREFHPDGYNVGVNVGAAAGQTIGHVHIHLIPRYRGDTANPRGGVRGVIPARQNY